MKNIHLIPTGKPSKLQLSETGNYYLIDKIGFYRTSRPQHIYITSDEEIKEGNYVLSGTNTMIKCMYPKNVVDKDVKKIILTTDPDLIKDGVQAIDDEFLEWFVKNPSYEEVKVLNKVDFFSKVNDKLIYKIIIPKEEAKQFTTEMLVDLKQKLDNATQKSNPLFSNYKQLNKQETLEEVCSKWSLEEAQKLALSKFKKRGTSTQGTVTWESILEVLKVGVLTGHKFGAKWQQERMYSEAIEFIEWINDPINPFIKHNNKWIQVCGNSTSWTTKELFEQFKKK